MVTVVYNGELYNAPLLRGELSRKGHRFRSTSDTEVLLRGYIEWGDAVVGRIEGIFSFAIVDEKAGRVLLARDRLGVKPLYWSVSDGRLAAGSAPRALLAVQPDVRHDIDRVALAQFLTLLWIPHPRTPWVNIKKLAPGHALSFRNGIAKTWRYWEGEIAQESPLDAHSLFTALSGAVSRQLLSDVPVGLLLSGGLDSTLLGYMMMDHYEVGALQALTAAYETDAQKLELAPDDSVFARDVAGRCSAMNLNEITIDIDADRDVDALSRHFDDPVADPAAITLYRLCQASDSKVLISGVGGEELWAGYPRHRNLGVARRAARAPVMSRIVASRASGVMYGARPGPAYGARRNLQKLARAVGERRPPHYWRMMSQLTFDELNALVPGAASQAHEELDSQTARLDQITLDQALRFDRDQFLPNLNLAYVDKASMATGVEVRVPMLDEHVVGITYAADAETFLVNGVTKFPLRQAAEGTVPRMIIDRPKSGFGGPARAWFRGDKRDRLLGRVDSLADSGLVERQAAHHIYQSAASGRRDASLAAWALVCLQAWQEAYG